MSIVLLYAFYNYYHNEIILLECSIYSIAKPIEIKCTGKTGLCGYLAYSFNNNRIGIVGEDGIDGKIRKNNTDKELLNKRYLVKFSCNNPEVSKILWNIEVPNNINTPANGWDKIPYGLDKVRE